MRKMVEITKRQLLVAAVVCALFACGHAAIRGLNPQLAAHYSGTGGKFTCIDQSKAIDFSQVNDNYCDCYDGSDEPGTSACHNGRFYCANRGHEPSLLSASFVDDGVCDCCDGSDELSGCTNKCLEKSAEARQALRSKAEQYQRSLAKKAEQIQSAQSWKASWPSRVGTIDTEIEAQKAAVQAAEAEKERAQAEENERLRIANEEAQRQAEEAQKQAEEERKLQEQQQQQQADATPSATAGDAQQAGSEQAQDTQAVPHEETPEELGRRIASQWTHDPEAAAVPAGEHEPGHEDDIDHGEEEFPEGEEPEHGAYDEQQPEEGSGAKQAPKSEWDEFMFFWRMVQRQFKVWFTKLQGIMKHGIAADIEARRKKASARLQQEQATVSKPTKHYHTHQTHNYGQHHHTDPNSPVAEAQRKLQEEQQKLQELEKEKRNIERYSHPAFDFGPNNMFLAFAGRCFQDMSTRWTYEACFFETATQSEGHYKANLVRLGNWRGFTDGYSLAIFDNGDFCGAINQPRQLRIRLVCGAEERLYDASEPHTCVYDAYLSTPLACTEEEHTQVKTHLEQLEQLEREVLAEIAGASTAGAKKDEL